MKIFSWMQNKLNGNKKHDSNLVKKNHRRQEPCKEEFSDWPNGLLAIGTFGNDEIIDSNDQKQAEENISPQELTLEEIKKLQNELDVLLHKQVQQTCDHCSTRSDTQISISEEERSSSNACDRDHESRDNDRHLQPSPSAVLSRGRDLYLDNTSNNAINRKSLSFILKKMFVCRKGFTPAPSLRDQVPESRIEKILRAILHKKVYPQSTNPSMSMKKYLENNNYKPKSAIEDDTNDPQNADKGSKWVKTDSEYIVLEI